MDIGILLKPYDPEEVERAANEIAHYGYGAVDFQGLINTDLELFSLSEKEFEKTLEKDREIIKKAGLFISQTHGPWRYPIKDSTEEDRSERFEKMSKAIRGTAILGCPYIVLHPIMPFGREDNDRKTVFEINLEFFGRLSLVAKEYGVVICVENMPFEKQSLARPKDVLELLKTLGRKEVRFCLDTGHCAKTKESPADAVFSAGLEYLKVMHVHDNDSVKDLHQYPGKGVIDWKAFAESLAKVGFDGTLSLETRVDPEKVAPSDYDAENRALFAIAEKIARNAF